MIEIVFTTLFVVILFAPEVLPTDKNLREGLKFNLKQIKFLIVV